MRPPERPKLLGVPCHAPWQGTAQRRASFSPSQGPERRAVRPRPGPPGCRRPLSDPRCRRQCILRSAPFRPPRLMRPVLRVQGCFGASCAVTGKRLQPPGRAPAAPLRGPPARVAGEGAGGRDVPPAPPPRGGRGRRRRGQARAPPGGRTANSESLRKCVLLLSGRRAGALPPWRSMKAGPALPRPEPTSSIRQTYPATFTSARVGYLEPLPSAPWPRPSPCAPDPELRG